MIESFRSSRLHNRAQEIAWRSWGPAAFEAAAGADTPIFLHLTVGWCDWCRRMDETTFSDPAIIELLTNRVVAIRVDADRFPHVQDRYIAGGWPTNAFLTPTGELLWSATFVDAEQLATVAGEVLSAWAGRRDELQTEIARRQRGLEASRARLSSSGLVRREAADDVVSVALDTFDPRNGAFGDAPKFPPVPAIELMYLLAARGDAAWADRADVTLDGMLAGELLDTADGGFYRYALAADWTQPCREKLLETNAALLRSYALGASVRRRADWRAVAEGVVTWVERTLARQDGLWSGSQDADETYFAADAATRATLQPPAVDPALITAQNARWISALAEAGSRLERADWVARAAAALDTLLDAMAAPGDLLYHFRLDGAEPVIPYLLDDTLQTTLAALSVAQATGRSETFAHVLRLARALEREYWADAGGFHDRARSGDELGLLRFRDRPLEANAEAARLFLDIAGATGERRFRGCAERVLGMLSPMAGRYGVAAAGFALAVDEYFHGPLRIFIVGDNGDGPRDVAESRGRAAALRTAALALPRVDRRVFSIENGAHVGPLRLRSDTLPAAFACDRTACSVPITDPAALTASVLVPD
jgi:uncharacterized protein